jgi:hypothetical protein
LSGPKIVVVEVVDSEVVVLSGPGIEVVEVVDSELVGIVVEVVDLWALADNMSGLVNMLVEVEVSGVVEVALVVKVVEMY